MPATVITNDAEARLVLLNISKRARDMSPFFRSTVDPSMTRFLTNQFASEGRAGGSPWTPVRPLTTLLRTRPGHGRAGPTQVGQDVRRMWASFTKSGGPDSIRVIRPHYYERGSDNPTAARFHGGFRSFVFGRPTGRRVPARPIIPENMPGFILRTWETRLAQYLERGNLF